MNLIVAKSGKLKGKAFTLVSRLVIGRGTGADIIVSTDGASRKHAIILTREDGSVVLRDLGSRNGTTMDGVRVRQVLLTPGSRFSVGDAEFEYRSLEGGGMEPVPPSVGLMTGGSDRTTTDEGGSAGRRRELLALAKSLRENKSD